MCTELFLCSPQVTEDLAAAAGVNCSVDPLLTRIMSLHCGEERGGEGREGVGWEGMLACGCHVTSLSSDRSAEDLTTWTLLFVSPSRMCVCVCVYMHVCACVHAYVCTHVRRHTLPFGLPFVLPCELCMSVSAPRHVG